MGDADRKTEGGERPPISLRKRRVDPVKARRDLGPNIKIGMTALPNFVERVVLKKGVPLFSKVGREVVVIGGGGTVLALTFNKVEVSPHKEKGEDRDSPGNSRDFPKAAGVAISRSEIEIKNPELKTVLDGSELQVKRSSSKAGGKGGDLDSELIKDTSRKNSDNPPRGLDRIHEGGKSFGVPGDIIQNSITFFIMFLQSGVLEERDIVVRGDCGDIIFPVPMFDISKVRMSMKGVSVVCTYRKIVKKGPIHCVGLGLPLPLDEEEAALPGGDLAPD